MNLPAYRFVLSGLGLLLMVGALLAPPIIFFLPSLVFLPIGVGILWGSVASWLWPPTWRASLHSFFTFSFLGFGLTFVGYQEKGWDNVVIFGLYCLIAIFICKITDQHLRKKFST